MSSTLKIPSASSRPPSSVTIVTNPDERVDLREGVLLIAVGSLLGGLAVGYFVGRKKRRDANPKRIPRALPLT